MKKILMHAAIIAAVAAALHNRENSEDASAPNTPAPTTESAAR